MAINNFEDKEDYLSHPIEEVKKLLNHPSLIGAYIRNVSTNDLLKFYKRLESLTNRRITETNKIIKIEKMDLLEEVCLPTISKINFGSSSLSSQKKIKTVDQIEGWLCHSKGR